MCADAMAALDAKSPSCHVDCAGETLSEASQCDRMNANSSHYEWPPPGCDIDSDGHWSQISMPLSEPNPSSYHPTRSEVGAPDSPEKEELVEEDQDKQQHRIRMTTLAERVKHIEWILRNHSTAEGYVLMERLVRTWATTDDQNRPTIDAMDTNLIAAAKAQNSDLACLAWPAERKRKRSGEEL